MTQLVTDCPRCRAKCTTFDIIASHYTKQCEHNWMRWYDAFCLCRNCNCTTVFILRLTRNSSSTVVIQGGVEAIKGSVNDHFEVMGFRSLKDNVAKAPPNHLPMEIDTAFREGATCLAVSCFNGGATMFRLCIDHATQGLLPETDEMGLNRTIRRSLGLRMKWLFENNLLPASLKGLSTCVKEDGNDGAHAGDCAVHLGGD